MRTKQRFGGVLVLGMGLVFSACVPRLPPPRELQEARVVFQRASSGPGAQHSTAELKLAAEALHQAELSYGADRPDVVQHRAYLALRQGQVAEARANVALATERRERALNALVALGGAEADRARAELAKMHGQLSEEQAQGAVARQQVQEQTTRLEEERTRGVQTQQQLDAERAARQEAEARAQEAMAALARVAAVKKETRGMVVTLSGQVLFASDQTSLLPAPASSLDSVATALRALPPGGPPVVIEGHTDSQGADDYNRTLSGRRAEAVRAHLVSKGVPGNSLSVQGIGEARPVADNGSAEGRANNRRVEIVIPPGPVPSAPLPAAAAPVPR